MNKQHELLQHLFNANTYFKSESYHKTDQINTENRFVIIKRDEEEAVRCVVHADKAAHVVILGDLC